jgi:cyclopropane-fatty-acyl-phospholipid synthase
VYSSYSYQEGVTIALSSSISSSVSSGGSFRGDDGSVHADLKSCLCWTQFLQIMPGDVRGKRYAVIGSGVSGVASAWLLQHHGAKVTLFESEPTCGGHTLTDHTCQWPVDLGFQVYNLSTYPHLVGWLELLGVETEPSNMSFSLSVDDGALEWASHGLASIFAQRRNMLSIEFLSMIWDVLRFGREAPDVLKSGNLAEFSTMSLGGYLETKRYARLTDATPCLS